MAPVAGMRTSGAGHGHPDRMRGSDTMAKIPLTFACGLYDRMLALYTGEVQAEGIDLDFIAIDDPRQIFDRMGKNLQFDACEMSSSEVISRHAAGRREMVAAGLPLARLPARLHHGQPQGGADAEGPRR
jgi:hypothetical protein